MVDYIDQHRQEFGVEPICEVLAVAPSTYYAAKSRPLSARAKSDTVLGEALREIHAANFSVYGTRKMWKAMRRAGHDVGRDQVARLMKRQGLYGVRRAKRVRTTTRDDSAPRSPDLERCRDKLPEPTLANPGPTTRDGSSRAPLPRREIPPTSVDVRPSPFSVKLPTAVTFRFSE